MINKRIVYSLLTLVLCLPLCACFMPDERRKELSNELPQYSDVTLCAKKIQHTDPMMLAFVHLMSYGLVIPADIQYNSYLNDEMDKRGLTRAKCKVILEEEAQKRKEEESQQLQKSFNESDAHFDRVQP